MDVLNEIDISEYDRIYTCGPEIMMARVFEILHDAGAHGRVGSGLGFKKDVVNAAGGVFPHH